MGGKIVALAKVGGNLSVFENDINQNTILIKFDSYVEVINDYKSSDYQNLKDKSKNNAASALGVNPFFISAYQTAARNYSMNKLFKIFTYIKEYDLKSKGLNNPSTPTDELLKELTFKILH